LRRKANTEKVKLDKIKYGEKTYKEHKNCKGLRKEESSFEKCLTAYKKDRIMFKIAQGKYKSTNKVFKK